MSELEVLQDFYDHDTGGDSEILYTPVNIPGPGVDPTSFDEQFEGCSCSGIDGQVCKCIRTLNSYYFNGLIDVSKPPLMIYECHDQCQCPESLCSNRVVQRGPHRQLKVIQAGAKGWGVVSLTDLIPGTFVCQYAGEVIGAEEARRRFICNGTGVNYVFALREHFDLACPPVVTYIDPTHMGNIGRYLNHSCDPNMLIVPVRIGNAVPRIAFFARQYIPAGTELTYDYSGGNCIQPEISNPIEEPRSICLCASHNCRRFLPFDGSLA
jgi:histone-lysine N-methyltransferase SETMAR